MAARKNTAQAALSRAFGFDPTESRHHFLVSIPRGATREIRISEHFTWHDVHGSGPVSTGAHPDGQIRVVLPRPKWDAIADEARAELNQRLRKSGRKPGAWRAGQNLLRRDLGKELVLLAWAIEEADPALIPVALANWKGLVPEERWWLYTQTAAATGHGIQDRGKGWRKALRFALTENPLGNRPSEQPVVPEFYRIAAQKSEEQYTLFDGGPQPDQDEPES